MSGSVSYTGSTLVNAGTLLVPSGKLTKLGPQQYLQINKQGAGVWTLAGAADLPAGLTVNQGTLIVAGTVDNGGNTGNATVSAGNLIVNGTLPGTVTVNNPGTLGGAGVITNSVTVNTGGTLAPGVCNGAITTLLTLNSNLTLSGNLVFNLNKTNSLTSDQVVVNGLWLTNTAAGTLTLTNYGPALTNGDTFTLFSQPVSNGAALNLVGGGASVTWTNNLAVNGSITVLSVTPPVTVNTNAATADFQVAIASGALNFSWAADHRGWQLYTNSVGLAAPTSWFPVPGSSNGTSATLNLNPAKVNVFSSCVIREPAGNRLLVGLDRGRGAFLGGRSATFLPRNLKEIRSPNETLTTDGHRWIWIF